MKLKEGEKHPELQSFLYLLSLEKQDLEISQISRILEIDSKYQIYKKLNQVFIQNHIPIRKSWLNTSNINSYSHFIIEVDKNKKSKIKALEDYPSAESEYFKMFLENQTSNFVLIFIERPKFKEICIAYASYMMIKHDYLDDWNFFARKILKSEAKNGEIKSYNTYRDFIDRNLTDQQDLLNAEIDEIELHINENLEVQGIAVQDWIDELNERNAHINQFLDEINRLEPPKSPSFWKRIFK